MTDRKPAPKAGRGAPARPNLAGPYRGTKLSLEDLVSEALVARELAWAPFSGFKVGAAVLGAGGRVFRGANVESASYGLTNCAERVAVQKAVSEGERRIIAVAVAADASRLRGDPEAGKGTPGGGGAAEAGRSELDRFVSPCGACRQIIFEFGPDAAVVLADLEGGRLLTSTRELLPGGFRLDGGRKD